MTNFKRRPLAALLAALGCTAAIAQTPPDAGTVLREIEQRPRVPLVPIGPPPTISIQGESTKNLAPEAAAATLKLNGVRVTDSTVFPAEELEGLVDASLHGVVSLADVEQAAERITQHYRERGYILARAYVPPQDIADGRIRIAVVEGRYGAIQVANQSRVREATLERYVDRAHLGEVVNEDALNRALLVLREVVHGAPVTATLRPGAETGTSDLIVLVAGEPFVQARVEADNYGGRSTGRYRVGGAVQLNELFGFGDQLEVRVLTSTQGQDYLRLGWSTPLGSSGLRMEASFARSLYSLGGDFAALDASGNADVTGVTFSYPVVRGLGWNVTAQGGAEYKSLEDRVGALGTVARKSTSVLSLGANAERFGDEGDATSGSLRLESGRLNLKDAVSQATDAAGLGTRGSFSKLAFAALHSMPLADRWTFQASISGQSAGKNLDSSEKFSLGGPFGVRAYPVGEATGDSGWVSSAELRYLLAGLSGGVGVTLFGFLDYGSAKLNEDPLPTAAVNRRDLSAAGVGVSLVRPGDYAVRAMYAQRLGSELATSDRRGGRGQLWLQATKSF
ncbi:ShlB/FhaC/HecB family hemolysin secretion/activation protein [Ramlibacter humi]|uniref:ShlB/FhaC/HecB family hemolysin secretion/activation protein n=1 Tax=Ramlibacter humi TaxID=2530451 RepID=A0A4Z0BFF6_9BURK|nr:ShlB/FhaC/HecB family hemolysin secretion/activation protein [Ramlibacter humi]TFY96588.1 ShlB/FhaC/HecB family hemolysin secretion/activation protein [Ramlibacter humi]